MNFENYKNYLNEIDKLKDKTHTLENKVHTYKTLCSEKQSLENNLNYFIKIKDSKTIKSWELIPILNDDEYINNVKNIPNEYIKKTSDILINMLREEIDKLNIKIENI